MEKIILEREAVLGFVVTMSNRRFRARPISGDYEGYFATDVPDRVGDDETVIGVLPAPQNTFRVQGWTEHDDTDHELGFEFAGADHPDWEELYLEKFGDLITAGTGVSKSKRTEFKKLREIIQVTTDEKTILAAAETQGLGDAPRVLDMLKRLKEQGEIYAPKEGVWVRS